MQRLGCESHLMAFGASWVYALSSENAYGKIYGKFGYRVAPKEYDFRAERTLSRREVKIHERIEGDHLIKKMLRRTATVPFRLKEGKLPHHGKSPASPLNFYENVRHSTSRFHKHLTYSKMGNLSVRKNLVDPKLLKPGEPVSASIIMGDMVKARKFEWDCDSLNHRGFLRFQKPYTPPKNAMEMVLQLCRSSLNVTGDESSLLRTELSDPKLKYDLLAKAFEQFQHCVPNSLLHMMQTVADIVNFYNTPVDTQTPYESLVRSKDLPPNLHIQKEPIRFHPETDTLFGGQTAFTKSSTMVTGLRAKKKYRGYEAKMTWP